MNAVLDVVTRHALNGRTPADLAGEEAVRSIHLRLRD
jgi:hypothetical protein